MKIWLFPKFSEGQKNDYYINLFKSWAGRQMSRDKAKKYAEDYDYEKYKQYS